jgi:hypothetical protein
MIFHIVVFNISGDNSQVNTRLSFIIDSLSFLVSIGLGAATSNSDKLVDKPSPTFATKANAYTVPFIREVIVLQVIELVPLTESNKPAPAKGKHVHVPFATL